jgi:2-methylisocitrate lyase-like PEP mutase family enzyme
MHTDGIFLMPNPWDAGSARFLESMGFPALATTSSGHAATLGRGDQAVTREELLGHARVMATAVEVPVNVDAERCFADDPEGVAVMVGAIAETGAAGFSIEDFDPATRTIDPLETAIARVAAASRAARESGLVLTARAENHLYGINDLDDTLTRLCAYRDAGAEVVYAPGLVDVDAIARVVSEVEVPVNVLALTSGPSVAELESVGVRRVSTGGALTRAAFTALRDAARELMTEGTSSYAGRSLSFEEIVDAFAGRG